MGLNWRDTEEIVLQLLVKNPDIFPDSVASEDLPKWVGELPDFEDDLSRHPEGALQAIHAKWCEEWKEVNR